MACALSVEKILGMVVPATMPQLVHMVEILGRTSSAQPSAVNTIIV